MRKANTGRVRVQCIQPNVGHLEKNLPSRLNSRLDQIFNYLMLSIDRNRAAAGQLIHIDSVSPALKPQFNSVVYHAFTLKALTETCLVEKIHRSLLEHARPNSFF